ncbi:MAG: Ldh family oxidoreductase, partial [Litorilinea sp.]
LAMQKAKDAGIGMVAISNSFHFGAAGHYPAMALQEDMIGVGLTGRFAAKGSEIGVVPTFAAVPMFSTNPISIGFPTLEETPYLLDMATSTSPYNRITMFKELGRSVPLGWGTDANGNPSTDPNVIRHLFPLGGTREQGSHKGYGLSMMVEVLCAVLSGGWSNHFPPDDDTFEGYKQEGDAHFLAAFRVDLFQPVDDFKRAMDAMIRALHAAPKAEGQSRIYVPGEIEHETELERRAAGIPLPQNVVDTLQALGTEFGVDFPTSDLPLIPSLNQEAAL